MVRIGRLTDDLVLHYEGVDRLLGSPARLNRAIAVAAGVFLLAAAARLATGGTALGDLAVFIAFLSAIALVLWVYARLRFANAGLFLAGGRVGVMGSLGERKGVDASEVDHLQRCSVAGAQVRSYAVLLLVDRSGRAVLRLSTADLLPAAGLEEFSRRSGLPVHGSWQDTYAPAELARRFPKSVGRPTLVANSILEHPMRIRLITFGITTLAFAVLLVALLIRSG